MNHGEEKNRNELSDSRAQEFDVKEEGLKFEEKQKEFLAKLKEMPRSTEEERKARWEFFQSYPAKDSFITDVWMSSHPKAYNELMNQLSKKYDTPFGQDAGIASGESRSEVDLLLFQEAIKGAVESYTGRTKEGGEYVFIACVGQIYKQLAGEAVGKKALENQEGVSLSRWKRRELGRFIKTVKRALEEQYAGDPEKYDHLDEVIKAVLSGPMKYSVTKKDMELVMNHFSGKSRVVSIDEKRYKEENLTWADVIQEEEDNYQTVIDRMVPFMKDIEDNWEDIKAYENLKNQLICKLFLTRDVLLVLKTDKKQRPYREEPAGNEAAYQYFQPQGKFLYEKVFYEKYLCRAFAEKPEDFYETYERILREDFNFSYELLAEMEEKDRGTISRWRNKVYLQCMTAFY